MCCRLRLDLRELRKKSGGFFGSGESTGSIGVVTINMARLGYTCKGNFDLLLTKLENLTFVPVSDWLANYLKLSFLKNKRIHRIYNGIDLEIFQPYDNKTEVYNKYGIKDGELLIMGIANVWDGRKGLSDFIKLRELLPLNYAIIIIGLTKKQLSSLPKGIIGLQRTENVRELTEIYSAANVLFNPTWEDSFPTVNLEAMACGTPVVAYRTGGCPEQITNKTGIIVEQGDIDGAATQIRLICNSNRKVVAGKCRERIVDFFNQDDRFFDYYKLYKDLLLSKINVCPK